MIDLLNGIGYLSVFWPFEKVEIVYRSETLG